MPRGVVGNVATRGTIKHDEKTLIQVKREGLSHGIETFKKGLEVYARLLSSSGVRLIFRGMECYTTGKTIVVPEVGLLERPNMTEADVETAKDFLEAMRGHVVHEVGHMLFTDFEVIKEALKRPRGNLLKEVWNALEDAFIERKQVEKFMGARTILDNMNEWHSRRLVDKFSEANVSMLTKVVLGTCMVSKYGTDHWFYQQLPDEVKAVLQHLGPEIARTREIQNSWETLALAGDLLDKIDALTKEPPKKPKKKVDEDALGGAGKECEDDTAGKGGESEKDDAEDPGEDDSVDDPPGDDGDAGDDPRDEGDDADRDDADDSDAGEGEAEQGSDDDDEGGASPHGDPEDDEGGGNPSLGGPEDEGDDFSGEDEEGEGDEPEELDDATREALKGSVAEDEKAAEDLKEADRNNVISQALKNEIQNGPLASDRYLIYTTEYDKVLTPEVDEPARRAYVEMAKALRDPIAAGKTQLANLLKARTLSHTARDLDEGTLDRTRLYRLATRGDPRIYKETVERHDLKGVACSLVINLSGSMKCGESSYFGGALGQEKTRLDLAKEAALVFGECLDSIHVPFEVFGHSTTEHEGHLTWQQCPEEQRDLYMRWGGTIFEIYKGFDEEWSKVNARIMKATYMCNTHDAEALQFAAQRLLSLKDVKRRIIFTLDDGEPFPNIWDSSHIFTQNDKEFEHKQTWVGKHQDALKKMVPRVEARGVEVVQVEMASDSGGAYYKNRVAVQHTSDLSKIFLGKLREVLLPKSRR